MTSAPLTTRRYHLPICIKSEPNLRGHWTKRWQRAKEHRKAALIIPRGAHRLPCKVTITRVGKKQIDSHDNLRAGCKALVDAIAQRLGVDDADPRVYWRYKQKIGDYAAIVEIEDVSPEASGHGN